MRRLIFTTALVMATAVTAVAKPGQPVPYIDAHSHVLGQMSTDEEIALFRTAGLSGFAIMHPSAERLDSFRTAAPGYAVPWISLARLPQMEGLRLSDNSARIMAKLVAEGRACGFGEIPTRIIPRAEPTDERSLLTPDRLAIYATAHHLNLPVSLHVDIANPAVEASIHRIATDYPKGRIILAHSGWAASPEGSDRLLATHPNLDADLSGRLGPAGGLPQSAQPANALPAGAGNVISIVGEDGLIVSDWRRVIKRHSDRFLFDMDITDEERPKQISRLIAVGRKALSDLGPVAENAIAHGNFERLTAACSAAQRHKSRT